MSREAMKMALEALEYIHTETSAYEDELIHAAITALKQALAEPEQNPFGDDAKRYARKLREERESKQKAWFTVSELNEFATKLKEKAWKA
jgi:hypothetical protein